MCKSFSVACLFALLIGAFIGCNATDKTEDAAKSSLQTNTAQAATKSEAKQYRAVCVQKEYHGGKDYVLSIWLDDRKQAFDISNYHAEFKYKGHRVIIEERVKPEHVKPAQVKPEQVKP